MTALPAFVAAAGTHAARELDVRPVLERGGDPFALILETAQDLAADEARHLVVGFEPAPLYAVMRGLGRAAHTERDAAGAFHVWFYRDGAAPPPVEKRVETERAPLQPPVELDVRGLEPPQPMMTILEKLVELGPGAQLVVRHHREPVLPYPKLQARGYLARTVRRGEGDYVVHVAPAWAFEGA